MAAARCFRTLSRLSSHRTTFLAARPSIVGLQYFTRSYIAMPYVAQLKCFQPGQTWSIQLRPFGSGKGWPPTEAEVKETLLHVLRCFDKINPEQITFESHFIKDLGLDSLDVVEIIMFFEDELGVDITDDEAEKIFSCEDAFELIKTKMDFADPDK